MDILVPSQRFNSEFLFPEKFFSTGTQERKRSEAKERIPPFFRGELLNFRGGHSYL